MKRSMKGQILSSEWNTEWVREDASSDSEDGELPCVIGESAGDRNYSFTQYCTDGQTKGIYEIVLVAKIPGRSTLHASSTLLCHRHVDKLATEPFLLLHSEHGTDYLRSWNCCDQQTRFVTIGKHFCFILSTGTRIRIDSVMWARSSSRGRNTSASVMVTVTVNHSFQL